MTGDDIDILSHMDPRMKPPFTSLCKNEPMSLVVVLLKAALTLFTRRAVRWLSN